MSKILYTFKEVTLWSIQQDLTNTEPIIIETNEDTETGNSEDNSSENIG